MTIVSIDQIYQLDLLDSKPTPEKLLEYKEDQEKIREILECVGEVDRAAIVLYYWYDYSYDEIAEILSISQSAVKSRLHRARREMARRWIEKQSLNLQLERKRHESPAF